MSDQIAHLDQTTLQSYLGRELATERHERVEAHLSTCPRCRAELEGWRELFSELAGLPELQPTPAFGHRVMAAVLDPASAHPASEALQDLLDDRLSRAARTRVEAHLAGCDSCASDLRSWRTLHGALGGLPRHAPSEAFAARVMEAVAPRPVTAPAAPAWDRVRNAARGWLPKPGLGRKLATGALFAPVLGLFILAALVFLNPVTRPGDLLAFAGWQLSDLWQFTSAQVLQLITETSLLVWGTGIVDAVVASPVLALAGLATIWVALVASGWVLYRNVLAPHGSPSPHAHASR